MPFNPSDLPWWGWLLTASVAAIAAFGAWLGSRDPKQGCSAHLGCSILVFLFGVSAMVCAGIGIVRFAKWAWGG